MIVKLEKKDLERVELTMIINEWNTYQEKSKEIKANKNKEIIKKLTNNYRARKIRGKCW